MRARATHPAEGCGDLHQHPAAVDAGHTCSRSRQKSGELTCATAEVGDIQPFYVADQLDDGGALVQGIQSVRAGTRGEGATDVAVICPILLCHRPSLRPPWARPACCRYRGGTSIRLENVGIAVRDIEEAIAFFVDLGLTVVVRDTVSGEWADTAVGLDGNHAKIAMLQTPDGRGQVELFEYIHPAAIESSPARPNEIGVHRIAFAVDDIDVALAVVARRGYRPLRGVANYRGVYKLTYLRGPSGIIVTLTQELDAR